MLVKCKRNGKTTNYAYDGLGRLRLITDANNADTEYDYDKNGNRVKIVDGEGNQTAYEYNQYNQMTKETFADNSYIAYVYSLEGDLLNRRVHNASGAQVKNQAFTYDNGHRLETDGIYTYTYGSGVCSCGDRIYTATDSRGTTVYDYDYKGRVVKTTYPDGTIVENVYNDSAKTAT